MNKGLSSSLIFALLLAGCIKLMFLSINLHLWKLLIFLYPILFVAAIALGIWVILNRNSSILENQIIEIQTRILTHVNLKKKRNKKIKTEKIGTTTPSKP